MSALVQETQAMQRMSCIHTTLCVSFLMSLDKNVGMIYFVSLCMSWQQGMAHTEIYAHTHSLTRAHPHAWEAHASVQVSDRLSQLLYQMTLYLPTVLLSAKCHFCCWMQTRSQHLSLSPSPSVSPAGKTRIDTILRLTKKKKKAKNPEAKTQIPRTNAGKCEKQIMRERNRHRDMLNYKACPSEAWRVVFSSAECSVALTRGEGKVAEIDDSLRAVHTLRTDATTALP